MVDPRLKARAAPHRVAPALVVVPVAVGLLHIERRLRIRRPIPCGARFWSKATATMAASPELVAR